MNHFLKILFANSILFFSFAAPATLIKDINTVSRAQSFIIPHAQSGNKIFFSRATPEVGFELWVTDGTPGGTTFLKDIYPGTQSSFPSGFAPTTIGGQPGAYFLAQTPTQGVELWVTNGTPEGTNIVKDIRPGISDGIVSSALVPELLTFPGSPLVVFAADDGINGNELWASEGTSVATVRITNLKAGAGSSNPANLLFAGSFVIFAADSDANGRELFAMSLFTFGTFLASDINPGVNSSNPKNITLTNNKLVYTAENGVNGEALWETSLSLPAPNSSLVLDLPDTGSGINTFGNFSFSPTIATFFNISPLSVENNLIINLFSSNGTSAGTSNIASLNCLPGSLTSLYYGSFSSNFSKLVNGHQVFPCQNLVTQESELYITDAVAGSTGRLKDIFPGAGSADVATLFSGNNKAIFPANNSVNGLELWTTDGTAGGTTLLADFNPGEASSVDTEPLFIISLLNKNKDNYPQTASLIPLNIGNSNKVFYSDGSIGNTREIFDDSSTVNTGSAPTNFFAHGKGFLFNAKDSKLGNELFYTEGALANTNLVKNIFKSGDSNPRDFRKLGSKTLFVANHPNFGKELWVTTGKSAGTALVRNIKAGGDSNPIISNTTLKGKYLFSAESGVGRELWITNGTKKGTVLLKDTYPGATSGVSTEPITILGKKAIFVAKTPANGTELWVTDGTKTGTQLLKDIHPGAAASNPTNFTVLGKNVYFSAFTPGNGYELWKTNGTPAGTILVKDINPGATSSEPYGLVTSGALIYFTASDATSGKELWRSNGTNAGTFMVGDLAPGVSGSSIYNLTPFPGSKILFNLFTVATGEEPWVAGGTVGSATLLKDIYPGTTSSYITGFYTVPGKIRAYFGATSPENGKELWQTNGTPAGTVLAQDINPGSSSSNPTSFIAKNKKLYFSASKDAYGEEPHVYQIP